MDPKKIVLVSLYGHGVKGIPPLGILYLATVLKKNGHSVEIVHEEAIQIEKLIGKIDGFKPDLVGMSVFTGYNNEFYADLSDALKEKGHLIVWGNAHATLLLNQVLSDKSVDFVVMGEGEETLLELANNLGQPDKYKDILGLAFKDASGQIVVNPKRDFINIDDCLIDWSLVNVEEYLVPYFSNRYKRTLAVTTSRGCPYNCQFCYNLVFNNRRFRGHSVDKIVPNLKFIIDKYQIDALRFYDDNFFVNKERAFKIVEGLGVPYMAETRVEYVDAKFIADLKRTNCQEVMFGFESGSERVINEVIKKGSTKQDIIKAVTLFKDTDMLVSGSMIFGLPTETKEEYFMTMKFILELLEINSNLAFTCGWYLPYPGTVLYDKAIEMGFKPPETTREWDKLNRWSRDYEMDWLNWDYKQAVKYSRVIVNLVAMAYKRNLRFPKKIFYYRINHANYSWPIDIYLMGKIRFIYMHGGNKSWLELRLQSVMVKFVKLVQAKKK